MTRLAIKGLLGRKVRAFLTALSIVLGVAMVSGSFVLTDTISKAFTSIFSSAYDNTDAIVSGKKLVDYSSSGNATVSQATLAKIQRQPYVAAAATSGSARTLASSDSANGGRSVVASGLTAERPVIAASVPR